MDATCFKGLIFFIILQSYCTKPVDNLNILIFGGNGFIGAECTNSLLRAGHTVTLVNRGSNYYDYETRIKPYVVHFKCDRYKGLQNCNIPLTTQYDAIIDFSAYHPTVIEDALQYFRNNIGTYIYISTDSVYEVSIPTSHSKPSKETDSIRNPSKEQQQIANERDSYGHFKLQGEEVILQEHKLNGLKYVILRFSDVFGPCDTTYRWWAYQMWFQIFGKSGEPLYIPQGLQNLKTSYVYVKDIANIISKIAEDLAHEEERCLNQIYNFAYPTGINVRTLLDSMQLALGLQGIEYCYSDNPYYLYPSVTRGPMDVTKLIKAFQFEFTPWMQAVQETTNFFNKALTKFQTEKQEMLEKLHLLSGKDKQFLNVKVEDYILECNSKNQTRKKDEL